MTIRAAGVLFLTPDNKALFLKRGAGGDHPHEWCFPGGTTEGDETAEQTAEREAIEEVGKVPKGPRVELTRSLSGFAGKSTDLVHMAEGQGVVPVVDPAVEQVDFTTFLQRVATRFEPEDEAVNSEHVGFAWAPVDQPPEPLHPGCRIALSRLTMNELDVARAMSAGELTSPQRYMNMTMFAIRITGTGMAYRRALKEFVFREPSLYLNEEFLKRIAGLSVIFEHPTGAVLSSKEYADRVIGSVFLPYIKADEVWAIVKVYDDDAIKIMTFEPISTSPAVVLQGGENDIRLTTEEGDKVLIEGDPKLFDHIAVCPAGVWDKMLGPTGVTSADVRKDSDMAETEAEKKEREDRQKADAEHKERMDANIDRLLTGLDSVAKMCDSFGKRMDAVEQMADSARKDAEEAKGFMAEKAEEKAVNDRKRKDGETDEEYADRMDSMRKDGEDEDSFKERMKAKEDSKKDAQQTATISGLKAEIDSLKGRLTPRNDVDRTALADAQVRADQVFLALGTGRAPQYMEGETPTQYRSRLATALKGHSAVYKDMDLTPIADNQAMFKIAEDQIYADAVHAANNPVADGPVIRARTQTSESGHRVTSFVGNRSFVRDFSRARGVITGMPGLQRNGASN